MGEPGILFCISKEKFYLEPSFIIFIDQKAIKVHIGGEKNGITAGGFLLKIGDTDIALQRLNDLLLTIAV